MKYITHMCGLLGLACAVAGAPSAHAASVRSVETYETDIYGFVFVDNFWSFVPGSTDASDPVPVARLSLTFEIDYTSSTSAPTVVHDLSVLDLALVTVAVPNLSNAATLDLSDVVQLTPSSGPGGNGTVEVGFAGFINSAGAGQHRFDVTFSDVDLLSGEDEGASAEATVTFASLAGFDTPRYAATGGGVGTVGGTVQQTWVVKQLSSDTVAPIPLPGAGGLLLAGVLVSGLTLRSVRQNR